MTLGWARTLGDRTSRASDGLRRIRPSTAGVDVDAVLAFLDDASAAGLELNSVMLFRNGGVAVEGWWWPYRPDLVHMLHSATKSFTGTAIGIAVGEGLLRLDDPVLKFFPQRVSNPSANLQAMTVESLLTQTAGHASGISGSSWRPLATSWIDEFFKVDVPYPPGSHFAYSSATSYLLSAIITKLTGQPLTEYLRPRLFDPLGMHNPRWDLSPEGVSPGGNGLSTTTADFVKLGVLHLEKGRWQGRQIVPKAWTDAVARPTHGNDYSYQWWLIPNGLGYFAAGKFGQFCYVVPGLNAVLGMTAGVADNAETRQRMHKLAFDHLPRMCPSSSPLRQHSADSELSPRLSRLRILPPLESAASPLQREISGRSFDFATNEDGIRSVRLTFHRDEARFEMIDERGAHVVQNGLRNWREGVTTITGGYLHHDYEPGSMRVVAGGRWTTAKRFEMTWQFVESGFRDTAALTFDESRVRYDRSVNVNSGPLARPTLEGVAVS